MTTLHGLGGEQAPLVASVVDSCGWLEYFGDGPNAGFFAGPLENTAQLLVPALCIYEVCKRVLVLHGDAAAREAHAIMRKGAMVQLDADGLFAAAVASARYGLAMGDAIIWQTAQSHNAYLYTQDAALKDLTNVRFVATQKAR